MVSFGILLILAGTIAAIILTTAKARRLAALQMEFVTGVTHELRTPLAVILSASENIKDGVVSKPPQLARYGDMIHRQTKQLMQLVEQVLLFASSRQSHLKFEPQPTDVIPVIEAALQTAKDSGVTVERHFDSDLPLVMADPGALTQCFQNLVGNAVKYGGTERWIGVDACKHSENGVAQVAIVVKDRGIGIQRSELPHIFEPFYRSPAVSASNVHGTGLGLSLTKSMIEAMGGHIAVESQPGRGSSFTVYLPAAASVHAASSEPRSSEPREESDTRIPHV
jgi:signal transduction histidine kinase